MAIHGLSSEDRFEASSREILDRYGIQLTVGYNFDEYKELVAEARPDHTVGDPFNHHIHDMNGKALWIMGRDEHGKIMHFQALRVLPTGQRSVAEYFRHSFHEFSPPNLEVDFQRSRYRAGPGAKMLRGRVVYGGELWIGGEPGQYRGTNLSNLFGRFSFLVALREFDPDYILGFMTRPVAYKGFVIRLGYMHAEPMALRWYLKGRPDPLEGVMTYMSREDMRWILDLPSEEMAALAA